ncbi:MAG: Arc family DNA-binding protein [Nitrospirae bacterium]|jgi:hypothetical protein|nr:Arc family DNA-binding protein [Nitrospirota bacterium]
MKRFTLRLDENIYWRVRVLARKHKRSLNNEICFLLQEVLQSSEAILVEQPQRKEKQNAE